MFRLEMELVSCMERVVVINPQFVDCGWQVAYNGQTDVCKLFRANSSTTEMADGARFRAPLCVATALLVTGMRKQETCHFPDHSMDFLSFSFHLAHHPSATNSKEEQSENIQQYLMQRILVQSGQLSQPNRHLPAQLPILFRFFPLPSYVAIIYKLWYKQGL